MTKFQAFARSKCPRCREGKMFEGAVYGFKKQKANEYCSFCNLKFEIEPGYFYAAMYVSYAFVVAQTVTLAIATYILTQSESPLLYLGVLLFGIIGFAPFNFRYGRLVLIHYLTPAVKYNPNYKSKYLTGK